jgi:tetratricopeptide (TPR) repeat protein
MRASNKILTWLVAILVFLVPVFFLPLTSDFYFLNKTLLLYISVGLFLIIWASKVAQKGKLRLIRSPLDLPILLFTLSYLLAILFVSPNRVMALLGRGGLVLSLTIIYFVITSNLVSILYSLYSLVTSATLLSLLAIYQHIGVGQKLFSLPAWMQLKTWTPAGSPLVLITFLIPVFLLTLIFALRQKDSLIKILLFMGAALQVTAIILMGSLLLPGGQFAINLLPFKAGWQVAVGAFGSSPLLGVGPENFLSAMAQYRPIYLNNLDNWNIRFTASSNEFFQVFSTLGLLGLFTFLLMILRALQSSLHRSPASLRYPLYAIFLAQFLLPANLILLFLEYLFLAFLVVDLKNAGSEDIHETQVRLAFLERNPLIILIPTVVLTLGFYYLVARAWMGDYYLRQSLLAAAENRGKDTYDFQIKAINLNPYVDQYRLTYSQTNFALANSLASRTDISDQDRQNITQLVQQAIREAKVAIALNRNKVTNWENLANLYRNLINFAQGADQWAIASYIQAIRLDPTNPILRINLGGLYFSLGNYDEAIRQFQISTELKPDYANAYYNLSAAYREKGEFLRAFDYMNIVTNMVDVNSGDYQRAQRELDELRKKLPEAVEPTEVKEAETLQEPESLPTPILTPPLELPEEAQPEISPEPSPSPTPEPTAIPTLSPTLTP